MGPLTHDKACPCETSPYSCGAGDLGSCTVIRVGAVASCSSINTATACADAHSWFGYLSSEVINGTATGYGVTIKFDTAAPLYNSCTALYTWELQDAGVAVASGTITQASGLPVSGLDIKASDYPAGGTGHDVHLSLMGPNRR